MRPGLHPKSRKTVGFVSPPAPNYLFARDLQMALLGMSEAKRGIEGKLRYLNLRGTAEWLFGERSRLMDQIEHAIRTLLAPSTRTP